MAMCNACHGAGWIVTATNGRIHCIHCNGSGQQPEAPAPADPAAPAELAAKLRRVGSKFNARRCPGITGEEAQAISEAAALVTRQAEQLQRQAAVIEAARVTQKWVDWCLQFCQAPSLTELQRNHAALQTALAALEATDGR